MRPLFEACKLLIQTHARRLPLIDRDDQTDKEVVLSVLTQYRVLKFMAVNVSLLKMYQPPLNNGRLSIRSLYSAGRRFTWIRRFASWTLGRIANLHLNTITRTIH